MTLASTGPSTYRSDFQESLRHSEAESPVWFRKLKEDAWARFASIGFPTARRGNEKWKYTNVAPIAKSSFSSSLDVPPDWTVSQSRLEDIAPWHPDWINLIFIDGIFSRELSTPPEASYGAKVINLAETIKYDEALVKEHLGGLASFEDDGFTALNTAFLRHGAFVQVPDNHPPGMVVQLVFLTTDRGQPRATYPRTLVLIGRNTEATVVESYVSICPDQYFTDAVTEIVLGDGSAVDHYRVLLEGSASYHVGSTQVSQARDSNFSSASFALGTALARNDLQVTLDAPGSYCSLNGLYLTGEEQHIDNLINIDHAKPHTTSRLLYKGILDGKSKAVFGGQVLVRRDAQKADAQQTDKNLLLSRSAEIDSKPSLMIYADDVKCAHGATAGHMDENAMFYLRSRGLDQATASQMLIQAFAAEVLERVKLEQLRNHLDKVFLGALSSRSLPTGAET
jgi:Fe-S cluster assembly protein SufD